MEGYMEGNVWGVVRQLADGGASHTQWRLTAVATMQMTRRVSRERRRVSLGGFVNVATPLLPRSRPPQAANTRRGGGDFSLHAWPRTGRGTPWNVHHCRCCRRRRCSMPRQRLGGLSHWLSSHL